MKGKNLFLIAAFIAFAKISFAQRIIGDCTIIYDVVIDKGSDSTLVPNNLTKTVYIKGKQVRIDLTSPSFNQTTIFSSSNGTAVILKEVGTNKYISTFDEAIWKQKNKQYENIETTFSAGEETILGYRCKKAVSKLKDGKTIEMYYTTDIAPSTQENPYQFKNIPGLVLQYQSQLEGSNRVIIFKAVKIDLSPVPMSKFDIPKSGYRVL